MSENWLTGTLKKAAAVFLLFVLYCLVVIAPENLRRAIFAIVDMVCVLFLINCYLREDAQLRKFFVVYVFCAFLAFFTGSRMENIEQGAKHQNRTYESIPLKGYE